MDIETADFVHQQMNQKQYGFKISKKDLGVKAIIPLHASVITDGVKHAYSIYPYAIAGKGQRKVKFVQDITGSFKF